MSRHIVAAIALITSPFVCLAATQGSITISATVPITTEITVTPESLPNALPVRAGATDLKVATVNKRTNVPKGYTVTLKSQNAGTGSQAVLKPAGPANSDEVKYSLKFDGTAVNLVGGEALVTTVGGRSGPNGVNKDLTVSFLPNPGIASGTYSDKITLTIAAK